MLHYDRVILQDNIKQRLISGVNWFPYPGLITVLLLLMFLGHSLIAINYRVGSLAKVTSITTNNTSSSAIWLSVFLSNKNIVVLSDDKTVFSWSKKTIKEGTHQLSKYLQERLFKIALKSALSQKMSFSPAKVMFAVDKKIKFSQFRVLISVIASLGISDYGFEVIKPFS